jgi:hypothetical protein
VESGNICLLNLTLGSNAFLFGHNGDNLTAYNSTNAKFPSLEDFMMLHEGGDTYELFTRCFLRKIVGEKEWSNNCYRSLLSEYCTASDEAFGLLTIENNYDRWTYMQGSGDYGDETKMAPQALYTNSGNAKHGKGAPRRFQGWSIDGYKRFDELHKMVKADRARPERTVFEEEMKDHFARRLAARQNKRKKKPENEESDEEEFYPAHDFDDVDMGGAVSDSDSESDNDSNGDSLMKERDCQVEDEDEEQDLSVTPADDSSSSGDEDDG